MDLGRSNTNRTSISRSSYLPSISSTPTASYAQKYELMTKIANYNEMNESQIWKEYEKLRICLKQLNEQVLNLMEKKASANLYSKEAPPPPSVEATLLLLDEERKANQSRLQNFLNEGATLQQRIQQLTNRTEYLQEINNNIQATEAKIREIELENKDFKRKQKITSKDLVEGSTPLQRFLAEEEQLHFMKKRFERYDQRYKDALAKTQEFKQKIAEYQTILQNRVSQYKQQEDYVVEELNLQRFEQLQAQKANLVKYESVYKRNYLMKLKELENLVNSISKHDQIIQETQANILTMRGQIDQISALVVINNHKRRSSSTMMAPQNNQNRSIRKNTALENSINAKEVQVKITSANDKNRSPPKRF